MKPLKRSPRGRVCGICGKPGGMGATTLLRFLDYNVPRGTIGYAHSDCIHKERKKHRKTVYIVSKRSSMNSSTADQQTEKNDE